MSLFSAGGESWGRLSVQFYPPKWILYIYVLELLAEECRGTAHSSGHTWRKLLAAALAGQTHSSRCNHRRYCSLGLVLGMFVQWRKTRILRCADSKQKHWPSASKGAEGKELSNRPRAEKVQKGNKAKEAKRGRCTWTCPKLKTKMAKWLVSAEFKIRFNILQNTLSICSKYYVYPIYVELEDELGWAWLRKLYRESENCCKISYLYVWVDNTYLKGYRNKQQQQRTKNIG